MKVIDILVLGLGAVAGAILGGFAFGMLYPALKNSLGLSITLPPEAGSGESLVPVADLAVPYRMAGGLIDLLVLVAFIVAGALAVTGILHAARKR